MDKKRCTSGVVLVLIFLSFFSIVTNSNIEDSHDEVHSKKSSLWLWQRLRSAYSIYSSIFLPTSVSQYWNMVKGLVNHTYAYFFPPNIERGDGAEVVADENGACEKVKEAIVKSIGTSKATLEDAAKSAADIAGEKEL
uniref:Uncharacterized protein LOC101512441 isoform X2 n=1 Tax=Cicer arietinum TaxID=3827 RepID=A0A1S3EE85_CICAR|nr:uncharacterized protein LOC101512441 isoform X2 [Cicer arietinum]